MRYRLRTLLILLAVGPPMLAAFAQEKANPGEALYGEWEVVEMTLHGKVQDFRGKPGGWFLFEPGGFIRSFNEEQRDDAKNNKVIRKLAILPCIIRPPQLA